MLQNKTTNFDRFRSIASTSFTNDTSLAIYMDRDKDNYELGELGKVSFIDGTALDLPQVVG